MPVLNAHARIPVCGLISLEARIGLLEGKSLSKLIFKLAES